MAASSESGLKHTDYTVACICPMGLELAPVKAMLDVVHESLPTGRSQNNYTLGRLGNHNVVTAVLPETGNTMAAVVATQLLNDFPAVRFGLLVGIGGGVPGDIDDGDEDDVRLGDVVVGLPRGSSPGFVQYDLGKRLTGGGFERTGALNKPPQVLLAAVKNLQADHLMNFSKVDAYLTDMMTRYPAMKRTYTSPGVNEDILFAASYSHSQGKTCNACSREQSLQRPPRDTRSPMIHYGVIGSANSVVKDPLVRDELKRDTGLLCVEMEAAGMVEAFPCLVIRGICDYADSHKNNRWQPYAASTAAAYMKELLMTIPVQKVAQEPKAADLIQEGQSSHRVVPKATRNSKVTVSSANQQFHDALRTTEYESFKDQIPCRADGTGSWLLKHDSFQQWKQTDHINTLYVTAGIGCGKSVLARFLVDHDLPSNHETAICYYFFQHSGEQRQLQHALYAILHQLFQQRPYLISQAIRQRYKTIGSSQDKSERLWQVLEYVAQDIFSPPIICVLDGTDVCGDDDRAKLYSLLQKLHISCSTNKGPALKFFITIRAEVGCSYDVLDTGRRSCRVHFPGDTPGLSVSKDVAIIVEPLVASLAKEFLLTDAASKRLEQKLSSAELATYHWMYLANYYIRQQLRSDSASSDMDFNDLPLSTTNAYRLILSKVPSEQAKIFDKLFTILIASKQQLAVGELSIAMGVALEDIPKDSKTLGLHKNRLQELIAQFCNPLILINCNRVSLISTTLRDYLLKMFANLAVDQIICTSPLAEASLRLATICLDYLCINNCSSMKVTNEHSSLYEFCCNWESYLGGHDISCRPNICRKALLQCVFREGQGIAVVKWYESCLQQWPEKLSREPCTSDQMDKVQTIENALVDVLDSVHQQRPFDRSLDLNAMYRLEGASYGGRMYGTERTMLTLAAEYNHVKIAKWLILHLAAVNVRVRDLEQIERTALNFACRRGDIKFAQLLIDEGAKIDIDKIELEGHYQQPALHDAAEPGHLEVVCLLLELNASVECLNYSKELALHGAARSGHTKVVQILWEAATKDGENKLRPWGNAVLNCAVVGNHYSIVEWLLDQGVEVDSHESVSPLMRACELGHNSIVQLLLAKGAKTNIKHRISGLTPSKVAVHKGNKELI